MDQTGQAGPVKILAGMITARPLLFTTGKERLEKEWGPVDLVSEMMDFYYTRYYEKEMGWPLYRQFISFANLIDPGNLANLKLFTNSLEDELAVEGKRRLNIDPGYLTPAKLVLATTKDRSHRIYLSGGIFAEVTLIRYRGSFMPLPWTYPDYRTEAYHQFFNKVRDICLEQMRDA